MKIPRKFTLIPEKILIKQEIIIEVEQDLLKIRGIIRSISKELGYNVINQTKIITAVSELTRNVLLYARKGSLFLEQISLVNKKGIKIRVKDSGPGIPDVEKVLEGGYSTSGGLGFGLSGTKRLMDEFEINTDIGKGTEVMIIKWVS